MTKEQAERLAQEIRETFPEHRVTLVEGILPDQCYLEVRRGLLSLGIHSQQEWNFALLAWGILRD